MYTKRTDFTHYTNWTKKRKTKRETDYSSQTVLSERGLFTQQ